MASLICRVPQHAAILSNIRACLEASSTYLLRLDPCCTVTGHTLALKSTLLAGTTRRRKQDQKLIIQTRHRVLTQQDVMRCMWLSVAMPAFAVACAHCAVPSFQKMHGQTMTHSDPRACGADRSACTRRGAGVWPGAHPIGSDHDDSQAQVRDNLRANRDASRDAATARQASRQEALQNTLNLSARQKQVYTHVASAYTFQYDGDGIDNAALGLPAGEGHADRVRALRPSPLQPIV